MSWPYLETGSDFNIRKTTNCLGVILVASVNECSTQQDVL